MIVYCTLCCKKKSLNKRKIKSIKRYLSGRIKKIYQKSNLDRVGFRIFSGKYGLLKPGKKIFWYDEKLSQKKISKMAGLLKKQILNERITRIVFFSYNLQRDKGAKPYFKSLKTACLEMKVDLRIRYL